MRSRTHCAFVLCLGAAALGVACDSEPKLDVHVATTPTAAARPAGAAAEERAAPPITQGAQMPASHPPMSAAPGPPAAQGPMPVLLPGGQGASALAWTVPEGWTAEPPANQTRRAQYRVRGPGGDSECVVFYFGPGQGGDPASNAQRWASQFEPPGGKPPAAPRTRNLTIGGMRVLMIETAGTYLSGGMMGGPVERKPGWALLGAVVEGPDANWYFKLTGPQASVSAQRAGFESLLKSLKRGA